MVSDLVSNPMLCSACLWVSVSCLNGKGIISASFYIDHVQKLHKMHRFAPS